MTGFAPEVNPICRQRAGVLEVSGQGMATVEDAQAALLPVANRIFNAITPFVAPRDGTVTVRMINARADAPLHVRNLKVQTYPAEQAVAKAEDLPAPGNRFNFAAVAWTDIRLDQNHPASADTNPGTEQRPLKTLKAALEKAQALMRQGTPARIRIAPGTYREGRMDSVGKSYPLFDGIEDPALRKAPLAIIGDEPGKVILSGAKADEWAPSTWTLVDAEKNLWKHTWPYTWGPSDDTFYPPEDPIGQRWETIFVNSQRLKQRIIEPWQYTKGEDVKWAVGMAHRLPGVWKLGTYLGPDVLQPGEFGVSEFGPGVKIKGAEYDGHPDPNTIWVRLPAGQTLTDANIEVPHYLGTTLFRNLSRIWLKNSSWKNSAALASTPPPVQPTTPAPVSTTRIISTNPSGLCIMAMVLLWQRSNFSPCAMADSKVVGAAMGVFMVPKG